MKELKKYLTINAVFSAISGLSMLAFSRRLKSLFTIEITLVFPLIGAILLVFGSFVYFVIVKQLSNKTLVTTITILDVIWVLGSLLIVIFAPFGISSIGNLLITIVAVWIAFLAYKQHINSKSKI